jgi:tRNA guanosine-2'-O-methyltransferase
MLGSAECILPEKCILVMGSEKEGIPALILSECDVLIEIPQVGITRSLNVQTAAGIVLCEYAKQHKL